MCCPTIPVHGLQSYSANSEKQVSISLGTEQGQFMLVLQLQYCYVSFIKLQEVCFLIKLQW